MIQKINCKEVYKKKLKTFAQAVANIKSNSNIAMSMHFSQPPGLLKAIDEHVNKNNLTNINLYYFYSVKYAAESVLKLENNSKIIPNTFFLSPVERNFNKISKTKKEPLIYNFYPCHFSESPKILGNKIEIDTFITTGTPPDKFGYINLGISNDYTSTLVKKAKNVIIEMNENMPRVFGAENNIHISKVSAVVENNVPLLEVLDSSEKPTEVELKLVKNVAKLIPDKATIQMGVGKIPNLVAKGLINHKDLGVHTEILTTGMIYLMKQGIVTNKFKNINKGKSVFTFCVGNKEMYDFLDNNPDFESHPAQYTNNPDIISQNDNAISINSVLEIDLFGQCNAEFIKGYQYSATGGQVDFVKGSYLSKNGKSIIVFGSKVKNKKISKIVPKLTGPVTTLRNDVQYVVTEYGAVNLKGLSIKQRAQALISIAHPDFREKLTKEAKRMKLI